MMDAIPLRLILGTLAALGGFGLLVYLAVTLAVRLVEFVERWALDDDIRTLAKRQSEAAVRAHRSH
jgi:hypothetical protein